MIIVKNQFNLGGVIRFIPFIGGFHTFWPVNMVIFWKKTWRVGHWVWFPLSHGGTPVIQSSWMSILIKKHSHGDDWGCPTLDLYLLGWATTLSMDMQVVRYQGWAVFFITHLINYSFLTKGGGYMNLYGRSFQHGPIIMRVGHDDSLLKARPKNGWSNSDTSKKHCVHPVVIKRAWLENFWP